MGATFVSAVGYASQTALAYLSEPAILGETVSYGLFDGLALVAFFTGVIAVASGWRRTDLTLRFGFVAIFYIVLAQTIQSLWD